MSPMILLFGKTFQAGDRNFEHRAFVFGAVYGSAQWNCFGFERGFAAWISFFSKAAVSARPKSCPVTKPNRGFVLSQVLILRFAAELHLGRPAQD
jgi:hypothetical protein